jgi:hypothetical protein
MRKLVVILSILTFLSAICIVTIAPSVSMQIAENRLKKDVQAAPEPTPQDTTITLSASVFRAILNDRDRHNEHVTDHALDTVAEVSHAGNISQTVTSVADSNSDALVAGMMFICFAFIVIVLVKTKG